MDDDAGRTRATALAALPDADVVRRVRSGEVALFEMLMRRYNQRVFRVTRAILRDDAEAEDVVQQAWVNAYSHLDQFAGRASFATWLTRIAMYEAFARRRRRGRLQEVEAMSEPGDAGQGPPSRDADPERQAWSAELRAALEASLDALPQIYRSVFVLREVEALDTAEAADCLGVSEDVVKTRLSRARALLRNELYERAGIAAPDVFSFQGERCDRIVAATLARLGIASPQVH